MGGPGKLFARSLRNRLVLYFTLLAMVPLSVAGYLIYLASDARISDGALELAVQIVEKDSDAVNQVLADMQSAAHMVIADDTVQELLQKTVTTAEQRKAAADELGARLRQISQMYPGLNGIYLLRDDGLIAKSRYYPVRQELLLDEEKYQQIRDHASMNWSAQEQGSIVVENMDDAVLSLATSVDLRESGRPCGIVIVEARQSYLNRLMEADFGRRGSVFLMDPGGDTILQGLTADEAVVSEAAEHVRQTIAGMTLETVDLGDRLLLYDWLPSNGWVVAGVVFKSFLRNDSEDILQVFLLTALGAFVLNLILSRFLANFELAPIKRIQAYILQVEQGQFGRPLRPVRQDEIGSLTESVQEMSRKIGELLEDVQTKQEQMRTSEFKALQAQINPHFLYNSLDSINWLARRGDVQKTTEMITALTTFFRIGLSKGRDVITVKEELEHVRSYLVIQKIRYENQFEYAIYTDPAAENVIVPKLMLQPLVENALYHGIKVCDRKCMLIVQVMAKEDVLEIEVLDTGAGMDEETLKGLRDAMDHVGQNQTNSYGIVNVNDRIRILAGEQYGLTFTSEKGVGTSVRIVLPRDLKGV